MKKTYIEPQVKICFVDSESLLDDVSGVTGDNGTEYGGVDTGGTKDPDANESNVWDDAPSYQVEW